MSEVTWIAMMHFFFYSSVPVIVDILVQYNFVAVVVAVHPVIFNYVFLSVMFSEVFSNHRSKKGFFFYLTYMS